MPHPVDYLANQNAALTNYQDKANKLLNRLSNELAAANEEAENKKDKFELFVEVNRQTIQIIDSLQNKVRSMETLLQQKEELLRQKDEKIKELEAENSKDITQ